MGGTQKWGAPNPQSPPDTSQDLGCPRPLQAGGDMPPAPLRKAPCPPPWPPPRDALSFPSPNLCHLGLIGFPGSHGEIKSPQIRQPRNWVIHGELRESSGGSQPASTQASAPAPPARRGAAGAWFGLSGLPFLPPHPPPAPGVRAHPLRRAGRARGPRGARGVGRGRRRHGERGERRG